MFEETIIVHNQQLNNLLNKNKRFTYLADIMQNPHLDHSFKTYFNAEVEWWIYEESIRRRIHVNFDFDNESLKNNLSNIDELLFNSARFDRNSLKITIDSSITTLINFFLRPRTALKWFVFRGEPTKPFNEIIKRLNYFNEYQYLILGFLNYVEENHIQRNPDDLFSVIEFNRIIEKIDNDYLFTLLPEDFINLLLPVFKIFNPAIPDIDSKTPIPSEALIIFLDDKGIDPLKQSVENHLIQNKLKYITSDQFLKIIYDLINQLDSEGIVSPAIPTLTEQKFIIPDFNLNDFNNTSKEEVLTDEIYINTDAESINISDPDDEFITDEIVEFTNEESDLSDFELIKTATDSITEESIIEISDEIDSPIIETLPEDDFLPKEVEDSSDIRNDVLLTDFPSDEILIEEETRSEESFIDLLEVQDNTNEDGNELENIFAPEIDAKQEIIPEEIHDETENSEDEEEAISEETILEQEQQMLSDFRELSELSDQINTSFSKVLDLREIDESDGDSNITLSEVTQVETENIDESISNEESAILDIDEISDDITEIKQKNFDHFVDGEEIIKFDNK
jgi:hypothetical protein